MTEIKNILQELDNAVNDESWGDASGALQRIAVLAQNQIWLVENTVACEQAIQTIAELRRRLENKRRSVRQEMRGEKKLAQAQSCYIAAQQNDTNR